MAFTGKTVLITGGASGLGLECARKFYEEKANVIVLDRNKELLEEVGLRFPGIQTISVDLLNWNETREVLQKIEAVDHLVNSAGVVRSESFLDVTSEALEFTFGVNFKAVVNVCQVIGAKMVEKGGTIVNIASVAAKVVLPMKQDSMYSASKAAVLSLTRSMAVELGPKIRVNAICPTAMITPLTQEAFTSNMEFMQNVVLKRAPIPRFLEAAEAAEAVLFLSSEKSSMITGTSLDIDGGVLVT